MKWWKSPLLLGLLLILVTNGVVLLGVAENRRGEPESRVVLSQRELGGRQSWRHRMGNHEDNSLSLPLIWRVPVADDQIDAYRWGWTRSGYPPAWLTEERLAALGVDVTALKSAAQTGKTRGRREAADRVVLVVLELAGPAWQHAVEQVRRTRQEASGKVDSKEKQDNIQNAEKLLRKVETEDSRLYAVDAGLDAGALRQRYPDRSHYLILPARLTMWVTHPEGQEARVKGHFEDLLVPEIHAPRAVQQALAALPAPARDDGDDGDEGRGLPPATPFHATLVVGSRLEPWIEGISPP